MQRYSIIRSLNLPEFKIEKIIKENESEIHFKVRAYKRKNFVCSGCSKVHEISNHGYAKAIVEDRRMINQRVYLHVIKRRQRCPEDNQIHVEQIDWLKPRSRVTERYAKDIYRLTAITTNTEAGWYLGLDDEKIYRIDKRILEELFKERLRPTPLSENISVDEVSYKKHHRYLTNVIDVDQKVVTWNAKGRKAKVLDEYYASLPKKGSKNIKSVALDGAKTFISSTKKWATNAVIVLDRFHAVNKINTTLELVRKAELRQARKDENKDLIELTNCKQRFILLKRNKNLTERQASTLDRLCEINKPIYKALILKEDFLSIYDAQNEVQAKERIDDWIQKALESELEPFIHLAWSITEKTQLILNWFKRRVSSAVSEGFNNKIKRLKRMAYGYRDIEYFKLKIHQHCGYLNPRRFSH